MKTLLRAVVRRLVPFVSRRPALAAIAGRLFGLMPSLRRRVRHLVSAPAALPRSERNLSAEEAGALSDIRRALRRAHAPRG